jgi:tRNA pseudouridine55 synthase
MSDDRWPTDVELEAVLAKFRGSFLQVPPPYSAKKVASVPAYEKARKNQAVELKPVPVTVHQLDLLSPSAIGHRPSDIDHRPSPIGHRPSDIGHDSLLRLRVAASAGFYVRSLAHDIGQALGSGAHLETLRRSRVGRFRVDDALTLDRVEFEGAARLTSPNDLLGHMPAVTVTEDGARRVAHGNPVTGSETPGAGRVRLLDGAGILLAVAERRPGGLLQPVVVLR